MRRLFAILTMIYGFWAVSPAQKPDIAALREQVRTRSVNVNYSYKAQDKTALTLSGNVWLQGNSFVLKGNGMEAYCDGVTRWIVDREAKEVYIDDFGGIDAILSDSSQYQKYISGLKLSGRKDGPADKPDTFFRFDTSSLGADWIITDMRD